MIHSNWRRTELTLLQSDGKLSSGYEIINAGSQATRTLRVTASSTCSPPSAIPKRGYSAIPSTGPSCRPTTLRFTCVTSCVCLTAAVVSGHNSKSLRCANRVCQRSRWNVRPRVSTIIKPGPRSQSLHVRCDIHTWSLLFSARQGRVRGGHHRQKRADSTHVPKFRRNDKFATVINLRP